MATKDATVADLQKNFEESTAVLLTEYRGLTVAELRELRNIFRVVLRIEWILVLKLRAKKLQKSILVE